MNKYRIPANQTLFDAALVLYGGVEYAIKLILENPIIVDLNSDVSGLEIVYDENFKPEVLSPLLSSPKISANMVQTWKPYDGQTIFDIALQLDGGFENLVSLIKNSTLNNVNDEIDQTSIFVYTKKSSALLDWAEKAEYIFKTGFSSQRSAIIQENGLYLLLENGGRILL